MSNIITRDFIGHVFTFREDGYFNMTKAASIFEKDLSNFMRSPDAQEYIDALSNSVDSGLLVQAKAGRYGGTWAHPKLAVFFARWLDVKFAVFCDMVIDDILNKKAELTITKPEESAVMQLPKSFAEALRLAAELEEQKEALAAENKQLTLHTDSKYIADACNGWLENWKARGWKKADKKTPEHLDLWQSIDQLLQEKDVTVCWVKAHNGTVGNERADALACLGANGERHRKRISQGAESCLLGEGLEDT